MPYRLSALSFLFAALLVHPAGAATPAPSNPNPADAKSAAAEPKKPEAALKMGMAADIVIQVMGKPETVKPMAAEKGKAEVWAYERQIDDRIEHIDTSTPIMASTTDAAGQSHMVQTGEHVEYHNVHHITKEVVELLMFNDHFVTLKSTLKASQVME